MAIRTAEMEVVQSLKPQLNSGHTFEKERPALVPVVPSSFRPFLNEW